MENVHTFIMEPLQRNENRRTRRLQVFLMYGLGLSLIFAICVLTLSLSGFGRGAYLYDIGRTIELTLALLVIIYYGFGFFATHRCSIKGLRIFALIGIFVVNLIGIGIALYLVFFFISSTDGNNTKRRLSNYSTLTVAITVLIYIPSFICTMAVVVLAYILARAIDMDKHSIIQTI
ncbi:hypothetical protein I4U23_016234 [Adineta vaga]|nr:hypothetical protein I4U23_016234 [Adineta vaga]